MRKSKIYLRGILEWKKKKKKRDNTDSPQITMAQLTNIFFFWLYKHVKFMPLQEKLRDLFLG